MRRIRLLSHLVRYLKISLRRTRPITPYPHTPGIVAVTKRCIGIPKSFARAADGASRFTRCFKPNPAWARILVREVTTCPGPGDTTQHLPARYVADASMCN